MEEVEFNPQCICRATPLPLRVAVMLDLPAVLPTVPLAAVMGHGNNLDREFRAELVAAPLVGFLWCFLGLWLDRQLGLIDRPRCRQFLVRSVLRWTVLWIALIMLIGGIGGVISEVIHIGWDGGPLLIGGLLALVAFLNIRRAKNEAIARENES
jgi:hypothetical protein